jgi:hypothetical protein
MLLAQMLMVRNGRTNCGKINYNTLSPHHANRRFDQPKLKAWAWSQERPEHFKSSGF